MQSLKPVNSVSVFGSDEELINTIRAVSPDIMVKGSDWFGKTIIGEEYCGKIVFYERTNGDSTTKLLEDFINKNGIL